MRERKLPQRKCVGCEQMKDKKMLIRVVRSPEDADGKYSVTLDKTGKKAGRGAYVCPNKECVTKAVKGKRLQHALKSEISDDVFEALLEELGDGLKD